LVAQFPRCSAIYLNEVDKMLERAKAVTRRGRYPHIEYARIADDIVFLVDGYRRWNWLVNAAYGRVLEALGTLDVELNRDRTRRVDLAQGGNFIFLGFDFRQSITRRGVFGVRRLPRMKARTALLHKLREIFGRFPLQPARRVIDLNKPVLRGWVNYFRAGQSSRCFDYVKDWVEKEIRRHLKGASAWVLAGSAGCRPGIYGQLRLFPGYRVAPRLSKLSKALPA
jgi:RNA-directed DNA polymerase